MIKLGFFCARKRAAKELTQLSQEMPQSRPLDRTPMISTIARFAGTDTSSDMQQKNTVKKNPRKQPTHAAKSVSQLLCTWLYAKICKSLSPNLFQQMKGIHFGVRVLKVHAEFCACIKKTPVGLREFLHFALLMKTKESSIATGKKCLKHVQKHHNWKLKTF